MSLNFLSTESPAAPAQRLLRAPFEAHRGNAVPHAHSTRKEPLVTLHLKKKFSTSLIAIAALVPSLGLAATDDNNITKSPLTTARVWNLEANNLYVGGADSITSSTDKDHILVMCRGATVNSVGISYYLPEGDLDITVYDVNGKYLGQSNTKTDRDFLDIKSKGLKAVLLRVEGYNGATNSFDPKVSCEPIPTVNPRQISSG
jgi:hypothetical protein